MKYRSVAATRLGGPEVLQVVENDLRGPAKGEARIKILASCVTRPDVTVRRGEALYSGTPLVPKPPFVPGYAIVGVVDAVGEGVASAAVGDRVGALIVTGGYTEYLYWRGDRLVPVPESLHPGEAVTLILNYIVAYQSLHRAARVKVGDKVLITGASGGVGTAVLDLGRLAGLTMYGLASPSKHAALTRLGAIPLDYHHADWIQVIRQAEPEGLDAVVDAISGPYIHHGFSLLRRGGTLVSFGEPSSLLPLLAKLVFYNLLPNGKSMKLYGTSQYALFDRTPYLNDVAILCKLLEEGKISPVIHQKFPILDAAQANVLLESGDVIGNVILLAPELL